MFPSISLIFSFRLDDCCMIVGVIVIHQVNEGKVPKDRVALRMLAEEMMQWPNLEVQ